MVANTAAMLLVAAVAAAGTAHAALTPVAGHAVEDWATGFAANADGIGPVGLAVRGRSIYVSAFGSGRIHVFDQDAGGVAGPANELTASPLPGMLTGLAFDKAGRLYGALKGYGAVVEISLADGRVLRTVATNLPCVLGIATDPLSGDLFVSQPCGIAGIKRLRGAGGGPATASQYTSTGGREIDGIEFGADGTLYGADSHVYRVAGTNRPDAGTASLLATVPGADGLAVAASPQANEPPYLLTVTTNGTIDRIDLKSAPARVTRVASGGTRGDLAAVGSNGCLYGTQSDRVVKLTNSDGTCGLVPTLPNKPPFAGTAPASSPTGAAAATRALSILSLPRSARTLGRARSIRARIKLTGPPLSAVRLTLVDPRGRVLARGATKRMAGTRTLSLKRTRIRPRAGLVRLRVSGQPAAIRRITLVASRRLTR